jgi:hypothetical protein
MSWESDAKVREVIKEQRTECLFGNWQGFMAGHGDIWFEYTLKDPSFKVIAVNRLESKGQDRVFLDKATTGEGETVHSREPYPANSLVTLSAHNTNEE